MTVEEWLGKENKIGIDIWHKKYCDNNETFDEWLNRISNNNDKLKQLIIEKKFLFGGRILSNRGLNKNGEKVTYSNCYVVTPPEDSIESIFECASKLARTFSYGGGVGIDISKLAPRGSKVNNTAKETSGAVSFMDLYSMVTGLIGQNGRRGALMISIDCNHPDLEEFIDVKSDLDRVTKANISIKITKEFMDAVINDTDYNLTFIRKETGEEIIKTVNAKKIFHKIAGMNWDYAEPGFLYWDRIKSWNLLANTKSFEYAGTNPCLSGESLISTTNGLQQIKDLVGTNPYVYCMDNDGKLTIQQASKVWKTRENAQVVKIKSYKGELTCTPDHKIYTTNRGWVEAKDLVKGDKIKGLNRQMKDEKHVSVGLSGTDYTPEHRLVYSYFDNNIDGYDIHHKDNDPFNNKYSNLEKLPHSKHSEITNTNRKIECERNDKGQYIQKDIKKKRDSVNQGKSVGKNWFVIGVEYLTEHVDVYDMTIPDYHNFIANDMVVHNCAEEPLPSGGSCLLGSINLSEFVKDKEFDFNSFKYTVDVSVKALNNVLEDGLPLHPLQEQRDSVEKWRQIGLGIFGLADLLIKLGITYGSESSIALCDKIGKIMINQSLQTSSLLAKKYGRFSDCNVDEIMDTDFFKYNATKETKVLVKTYGLRNSQLLTIAPTGTLSTMLGVSGGIEPIYANYYERTTQSLYDKDVVYKVYTPIVEKYMKDNNISDEKQLPNYFITAQDLNYVNRINLQAMWQKHIDASISSTVNVPNGFTVEDVENLYMYGYKMGLKGVTIFRDGCKRSGILNTKTDKTDDTDKADANKKDTSYVLKRGDILLVNDDVIGKKRKLTTGCGSLHCSAWFDPVTGDLLETFFNKGSSGGCNNFMIGLSRMISLCSRLGGDIYTIVDQLNSCGLCSSYTNRTVSKHDTSKGACCPMAIGNALISMYKEVRSDLGLDDDDDDDNLDTTNTDSIKEMDKTINNISKIITNNTEIIGNTLKSIKPKLILEQNLIDNGICPQCGNKLVHSGGCIQCSCGWSKCL